MSMVTVTGSMHPYTWQCGTQGINCVKDVRIPYRFVLCKETVIVN